MPSGHEYAQGSLAAATAPAAGAVAAAAGAAAAGLVATAAAAEAGPASPCCAAAAGPACGVSPKDECVLPWTERERLDALRALGLVSKAQGPRFGPITAILRLLFDIPMAQVFLLEEHDVLEMPDDQGSADWPAYPRCESACKWVVEPERHEMLVVEDLSKDVRFHRSVWVASDAPTALRFYASAPLVSSDRGLRYGTLCCIDYKPRHYSAQHYQVLAHLAEVVVRELEGASLLRWRQLALEEAQGHARRLVRSPDCFSEILLLLDTDRPGWPICYANGAAARLAGLPQRQSAAGTPFWQLFRLAPGSSTTSGAGSTSDDQEQGREEAVRQAIQKRQPFSATFRLQAAAPGGSSSSSASSGCEVLRRASLGSSPAGGSLGSGSASCCGGGDALGVSPAPGVSQAPALVVTFTPASAPEFRPDEPAVGIPACATSCSSDPCSCSASSAVAAAGGASADGGAPDRYWFATLQHAPPSTRIAARGGAAAGGQSQLLPAGGRGVQYQCPGQPCACCGLESLRPANMADVQLGPLLGAGASGRTYRGRWMGGEVAVKIIDYWDSGRSSSRCSASSARGATAEECDADIPAGDQLNRASLSEQGGGGDGALALEAALSQALSHPHIVETYRWGISEPAPDAAFPEGRQKRQLWIVQTLCPLGTLAHALDRGLFQDLQTGVPRLQAILVTMREVAAALAYLHAVGVVHGDLTPNNILLSPCAKDSRQFTAMVADFGLSSPSALRGVDLAAGTRGSSGTVSHMPPEMLTEDEQSPATDVFSCGVCLWELMHGRRAWRGMGPFQIMNAVAIERRSLAIPDTWPPAVAGLVASCLQFDPSQRPTAQQVLEQLLVLTGEDLVDEGGDAAAHLAGA